MWPDKPGVMAARELTADDVAFSINRFLESPKLGMRTSERYDTPEAAYAKDKYTVVIKMKEYDANWLHVVGWGHIIWIVPPEAVEAGLNEWRNVTGTGPFVLADYVSGASLTWERNPIYWAKTEIQGKEYKLPFVDRMIWPIVVDESTQLAALRTAKCDTNEAVSWKYKETLAETNPELVRYRYLSTTAANVAMRCEAPPFDDIRVRRAMAMAIDRQALINTIYGGEGELLAYPFSPEWHEVYTPMEELPESAQELYQYNPEKAKQLLAEAGYPNGFEAHMVCLGADLPSLLVDYWENIGVQVTIEPHDYAVYLYLMYSKQYKEMYLMYKGNCQPFSEMAVIGIAGSVWNPANFSDDYYTDTYYKALGTPDRDEQNRLLKELQVYIIDQCPYIFGPLGYRYAYAWPWVKNWYGEINANARSPGQIHARIWLDRDLREEMTGRR